MGRYFFTFSNALFMKAPHSNIGLASGINELTIQGGKAVTILYHKFR